MEPTREALKMGPEECPWGNQHDAACPGLPEGLEDLAPGAGLGAMLAGVDRSTLCGNDTVALLQARSRQVAFDQAQLYADIAEVAHCSEAYGVERGPIGEFASDEIRAALCLTRRAADVALSLALDLVERVPEAWAALAAGEIDLARARVICEATVGLDTDEARALAKVALQRAPAQTTGQLGARLRRLVMALGPEAAQTRYREAVEERRLELHASSDGTAELVGSRLPADRAAAAMWRINQLARAARRAGDPRPIDQLRADIYLDQLQGNEQSTSGGRGVVDLRVDLTTLAGLAENPGEIPGFGPILADVARQVASRQHDSEWRVTVTDPETGSVVWNGLTRRRPTARQRRHIETRHRSCVFPGCRMPARDSDIDHTHPYAQGGATTVANSGPLCRHDHRLKHQGGWELQQNGHGQYTWTSRLGHVYTVGAGPP